MRLTASPHAVAAGVAVGAFTSFTPFMGLHFIIAFILAWLLRGNLIASALGTFVGNPLTFPFIWAATYGTGTWLLGTSYHGGEPPALGEAMAKIFQACWALDGGAALAGLSNIWIPILYPMLIGGAIVGTLVSVPIYLLTRRAAGVFRESRRERLMRKATEIRDRAKQLADKSALPEKGVLQ